MSQTEMTDSLNLLFTGPAQVELARQPVSPPGPGQALVETRRTLISTGTELICFHRRFEPGSHWDRWVQYPFSPGYSSAGVVREVGEGIEELRPGDRVATRSPHRQFVTVNAARALKIPDGVSDEEAIWFGLSGIVQNGVRRAEHELGDAVVVVGLGILGQLVAQYTRLLGAREVIAIDIAPARLQMAAAHGATRILEMPVGEALSEVQRLSDGRGADVVYDVTGHAAVLNAALPLVRRFGKLLLLGDTGTPSEQRLTSDVVTRGLRIIGAHDGNPPAAATDHAWWTHPNMARLFFTYLQRGQMRVSDMVTHRFRPEDAASAYELLTHDRASAMGVVFEWS
jgi:2-desacetyl-2-hydroxyethyl bacteriochlorophyllide A dehydrogenase